MSFFAILIALLLEQARPGVGRLHALDPGRQLEVAADVEVVEEGAALRDQAELGAVQGELGLLDAGTIIRVDEVQRTLSDNLILCVAGDRSDRRRDIAEATIQIALGHDVRRI